jgi:orotidine-5'-phosphate decarboxylase
MPATNQIDQLVSAIEHHGTPASVGIDPVFSKLPSTLQSLDEAEAIESFCLSVLDAIKGTVPAVKPQSACFERYGSIGYAILEKVVAKGRELGFVVILDAKRGDIGSSAQHYARGAADMGAHFITVSPYMGPSTIEPFLDAGLGVFALARTSNPDSDEVQLNELADGRHVVHAISSMIATMGAQQIGSAGVSALGAVVGATKAAGEMGKLREIMPDQMFLVPGVGAQGGTVEDVRPMCRPESQSCGQLGVIVNASRSVLYPGSGEQDWQQGVRQAANKFADSLRTLNN